MTSKVLTEKQVDLFNKAGYVGPIFQPKGLVEET
jgi:hypothetical protein